MTLRRATAADLEPIERMLARCSVRTRLLRFNVPVRELPRTYAAQIARPGRTDAHWVADAGGEIVALAGVAGAEIGVLVEDAWQRRGLGTRLLSRAVGEAARPIADGAGERAVALPDNDAAVDWLRGHLAAGEVVLVKASRAARLDEVAAALA